MKYRLVLSAEGSSAIEVLGMSDREGRGKLGRGRFEEAGPTAALPDFLDERDDDSDGTWRSMELLELETKLRNP